MLELNREIADERSLYRSERERLEAGMMLKPLDTERALAFYGLMLGILPPAAIFARWLTSASFQNPPPVWVVGIMTIVVLLSGLVGCVSGRVVGRAVRHFEKRSWSAMILTMPFIGLLWGMTAGGAGGLIIFVVGAFFGAFLGGMVGALALPAFVILHRLIKRGDDIDQRHFLPLAFGVTLTICSFILGL